MGKCCKQIRKKLEESQFQCVKDSHVVSETGGRKLTLRKTKGKGNPNACQINVDGCLLNNPKSRKCDAAFFVCDSNTWVFVEFKDNTNADYAIDQICATIDQMKKMGFGMEKRSISGVIVSSRVPGRTLKFNRNEKRFLSQYGSDLVQRSKQGHYNV